jgi:hypothetical protein
MSTKKPLSISPVIFFFIINFFKISFSNEVIFFVRNFLIFFLKKIVPELIKGDFFEK